MSSIPVNIPAPAYRGVAADIVAKFGGAKELAKLTGWNRGTIHAWVASGDIPEQYRRALIEIAKAQGIAHTPLDYVAYLIPFAA